MTYTIARYENVKNDQFLVGFNLTDDNENAAYVEAVLNKSDIAAKTQEEVCQLAYNSVKDKMDKIEADFEAKNESILGRIFVPTES
jgi:hypothetical protein